MSNGMTYKELRQFIRATLGIMRQIHNDRSMDIERAKALVSGFALLDEDRFFGKPKQSRQIEVALPGEQAQNVKGQGTWEEDEDSIKLKLSIPEELAKRIAAEEVYIEALEDLYEAVDDMAAHDDEMTKEVAEAYEHATTAKEQLARYRSGGG